MKARNIFKKKFKKFFDKNDTKTSTVTIPYFDDLTALHATEYYLPEEITLFDKQKDKVIKDILEKAHPDEFNAEYMDGEIDNLIVRAKNNLAMQRANHIRSLADIKIAMHAHIAAYNASIKDIDCQLEEGGILS